MADQKGGRKQPSRAASGKRNEPPAMMSWNVTENNISEETDDESDPKPHFPATGRCDEGLWENEARRTSLLTTMVKTVTMMVLIRKVKVVHNLTTGFCALRLKFTFKRN
eukprot:jgi/Bigna1/145900/aug1.105_g20608